MRTRLLAPSLLLLFLLTAFVATLLWNPLDKGEIESETRDFSLNTAAGTLKLEQLRGKVVILYFGYTWCPDVCPTSLALLGMALHKLEPKELAEIQPLFISVDPARDTVERLAEYTAYFHPALLGATGSLQQVDDVTQRYGVVFRRDDGGSSTDYTVEHSSQTYLLDRSGKLHQVLQHGTSPDRIVTAIRALLAL